MPSELLPTFSFQHGELQIAAAGTQWCLSGWPRPVAQVMDAQGRRRDARPEFRLFKPHEPDSPPLPADTLRHGADVSARLTEDAACAAQKQAAFEAFRRTFPPEVVGAVERFQGHQWNPVDLISRKEREALDLARINPALFFCFANNDRFRRHVLKPPAELAVWVLPWRQRRLVEWLGFPATAAVVSCLRKIPAESVSPWEARLLRSALLEQPAVLRALAHLPVINRSVLQMVCQWRLFELLTPGLLLEVAAVEEEKFYPHMADRLLDAVQLFTEVRQDQSPPRITSLRRIEEFHAEMVQEYQRVAEARIAQAQAAAAARERAEIERAQHARARRERTRQQREGREQARREQEAHERAARAEAQLAEAAREETRRDQCRREEAARRIEAEYARRASRQPVCNADGFPQPPVPGTAEIVPLTTLHELLVEAALMGNCVASYVDRIRTGACYIYRLLNPERAVFSLVRNGGGWRLGEIELSENRRVSPATVTFVRHWLDRRSLSI